MSRQRHRFGLALLLSAILVSAVGYPRIGVGAIPPTVAAAATRHLRAAHPAASAPGTAVIVGYDNFPDSFNLLQENTTAAFAISSLTNEPLIAINPATQQPVPALARSWDIAPDGKTYTFHLRPGVRFPDGRSLTADDVVYSIQLQNSGFIPAVSAVTKVDALTVRVTLLKPFPGLLDIWAYDFVGMFEL